MVASSWCRFAMGESNELDIHLPMLAGRNMVELLNC
jgi:hypothetical protein